jgi:hypothetical protein
MKRDQTIFSKSIFEVEGERLPANGGWPIAISIIVHPKLQISAGVP